MALGRPVILVVEDEPLLRMAAVDMVEFAGFEAIEAADAIEAIAILEHRSDIGTLFTDVEMPRGMDGVLLAACVRDRWPPIHIVVTSGHFRSPPGTLPQDTVFFPKPYKEKDVIAALRRVAAWRRSVR